MIISFLFFSRSCQGEEIVDNTRFHFYGVVLGSGASPISLFNDTTDAETDFDVEIGTELGMDSVEYELLWTKEDDASM